MIILCLKKNVYYVPLSTIKQQQNIYNTTTYIHTRQRQVNENNVGIFVVVAEDLDFVFFFVVFL